MTEKRYNEKLGELRERCPDSPFLPALLRGYSVVNVVYLQKAFQISMIPNSKNFNDSKRDGLESLKSEILESSESEIYISADNEVLRALDLDRRDLYRQLFVERKRFFDFPFTAEYNRDRAAVSDAVQGIQRRIKGLKERIGVYLETGKLPEVVAEKSEDKVFEVPDDPYLRMKKLNSLRAGLSRVEREIRQLVGMGALETDDRVVKKEKDRVYLRGCVLVLVKAIEKEKIV